MGEIKKNITQRVITTQIDYTTSVPFHRLTSYVVDHSLTSNDTLSPLTALHAPTDEQPVAGFGAIYTLIGDGSHSPSFSSAFTENKGSQAYVSTLSTVNLITFIFDGKRYWYNITQPK
jgi:hypothetical protein